MSLKAQVDDYIRHPDDGKLYQVMQVNEGDECYTLDDGSFVMDDEICNDDVLLESEGYDEFYRQVR